MSLTTANHPLNTAILIPRCIEQRTGDHKLTTAITAAAHPNGTAVATAERSAAIVSFQRHQPSLPPTQNVHSAPFSLASAAQFSGNTANVAAINKTFDRQT